MARKKAARAAGRIPVRMDSASIEEQTLERVDRTMATIENFLSRLDAGGSRMVPQIAKIRRFHEALGAWRRAALKTRKKGDDEDRIRRLRDFVMICRTYS
jgi:hypothetical protein